MNAFDTQLLAILKAIESFMWGLPLLVLLVPTGIYLTLALKGLQFRMLVHSLRLAFCSRQEETAGEGDITHFQALMTALSATVGTGNIAGVATAIALGGPGAVLWMWLTGLIGMATKYAEGVLGVYFRKVDEHGEMCGGPMYYIEEGLKQVPVLGWFGLPKALAILFAIFAAFGALTVGNMVQANSVADALNSSFGISTTVSGVVMAAFTALVVLGGIKRIGAVASAMVPTMIVLYVGGGILVLILNANQIWPAIELVFQSALHGTAPIVGGFAGAAVKQAMIYGLSRGVFSNESGMGSSPIAAAAAKTSHPVEQALVSMTQTFIDTIVVCSFTGLVIIVGGLWQQGDLTGATLTAKSFGMSLNTSLPWGEYIVAVCLMFFAYSTILGWGYYGERAVTYLFGYKGVMPYRLFYVVCVLVGALMQLDLVWTLGSVVVAFMVLPNLIALIALSPLVLRLTRDYMQANGVAEAYTQRAFHHD